MFLLLPSLWFSLLPDMYTTNWWRGFVIRNSWPPDPHSIVLRVWYEELGTSWHVVASWYLKVVQARKIWRAGHYTISGLYPKQFRICQQVIWSGNPSDLYSGDTLFKSRQSHWFPDWHIRSFLNSLKNMAELYLEMCSTSFHTLFYSYPLIDDRYICNTDDLKDSWSIQTPL
jgi:hypothetical protein